jgi:2-methylcitrate dehydratase
MPCRVQVVLRGGQTLVKESRDYPGFVSHPMSWEMVCNKFNLLMAPYATDAEREALIDAVADLENTRIRDLMRLLTSIRVQSTVGSRENA